MDCNAAVGYNQKDEVQMELSISDEKKKDEAVVADVLNYIIGVVCMRCITPPVCQYSVNRFDIMDPTSYRTAHSTRDDEEISERTFIIHSSDSDDEFERILESTRRRLLVQQEDEGDDDMEVITSHKTNARLIEHEYDNLPAIEELRIHVEEDILLEQFGKIVNVIDRLVVIEADSNTALDFDTVVFDAKRNAVGQIYDVFGPVAKPMYAILFNNVEEANEWKVGSAMFYAPSTAQFTHRIFTENLKQEKVADGCWDGEGECPDDMLAFSDDEAEQRYKAKHRSKKTNSRGKCANDSPNNKKPRYSSTLDRSGIPSRGRRNLARRFQRGSGRNQCDDWAASSSAEYSWVHQPPCWPPSGNRDRYRQFQPGYSRAPFQPAQQSSRSVDEGIRNPRQMPFHPGSGGGEMPFRILPQSQRFPLHRLNELSAQLGFSNVPSNTNSQMFPNLR